MVVIGCRFKLELVGASGFADAPSVAANTGAGADEPAEINLPCVRGYVGWCGVGG